MIFIVYIHNIYFASCVIFASNVLTCSRRQDGRSHGWFAIAISCAASANGTGTVAWPNSDCPGCWLLYPAGTNGRFPGRPKSRCDEIGINKWISLEMQNATPSSLVCFFFDPLWFTGKRWDDTSSVIKGGERVC